MALSESISDTVGGTPLIRVKSPGDVDVLAKVEWFNPGGSVKDRPALRMILKGERTGELTEDRVLLDSTSGNTGISYAMLCASRGYRVKIVLPANASWERKKMLRALGAEIVESDPHEGSDGAIRLAHELKEEDPERYFMPDQYNNPENWRAHYETTGPEIWEQTSGEVTHFVSGIGTGGTITGVGKRLKELEPDVRVVGVEPDDPLHGIEGLKHIETSIKPSVLDESIVDEVIHVSTEDAYDEGRRLTREQGLLVGQSSGAAMAACRELAGRIETGTIVTVFPDGGEKYISTQYLDDED
ncbi:MAG: Protein CysO [Methanonatronarchaeales archaeon]|nr:Protein CysO [Methanonatronarchaeales archaeon]